MHTPVLFEHPLNEKMRTWLRIEFLIQQMAFHPQIASHADALHFFRNAGDLLDVLAVFGALVVHDLVEVVQGLAVVFLGEVEGQQVEAKGE